jgi:hypothetical protein
MTAITIQIPYELQLPSPNGGLGPANQFFVTENSVAGNWSDFNPVPDQVHIPDSLRYGPRRFGPFHRQVPVGGDTCQRPAGFEREPGVGRRRTGRVCSRSGRDESPDTNWSTGHATRAHRGDVQNGL